VLSEVDLQVIHNLPQAAPRPHQGDTVSGSHRVPVGAENLCHLAGCSADRWLFGSAPGLPGRGMICGLWG
jgi:hypothetical protein